MSELVLARRLPGVHDVSRSDEPFPRSSTWASSQVTIVVTGRTPPASPSDHLAQELPRDRADTSLLIDTGLEVRCGVRSISRPPFLWTIPTPWLEHGVEPLIGMRRCASGDRGSRSSPASTCWCSWSSTTRRRSPRARGSASRFARRLSRVRIDIPARNYYYSVSCASSWPPHRVDRARARGERHLSDTRHPGRASSLCATSALHPPRVRDRSGLAVGAGALYARLIE